MKGLAFHGGCSLFSGYFQPLFAIPFTDGLYETDTTCLENERAVGWRRRRRLPSFPQAASEASVTVTFSPEEGTERWTRTFGGKAFSSVQMCGTRRNQYLLVERFGLVSCALALVVDAGRLFFIPPEMVLFGHPHTKILAAGRVEF